MNGGEGKGDFIRTDLWRDRNGAEGARLLKSHNLSGKRPELKIHVGIACILRGQIFIGFGF